MIPIDGMQRTPLEFGITVLLTCLAELRWTFLKAERCGAGAYFGMLCNDNRATCSSFFALNTLSLAPR